MNDAVSPELISEIRFAYRLCKSAESARMAIDQKLVSFARVYLTGWLPDGEKLDREKANRQALRCVELIRKLDREAREAVTGVDDESNAHGAMMAKLLASRPKPKDRRLVETMAPMVLGMEPARATFFQEEQRQEKIARGFAKKLPAWERLKHIRGFSEWHLATIVGEFGDLTDDACPQELRKPGQRYSGVRRIYKRLGWAPNESYPQGEKRSGRMIPRRSKGRTWGIIVVPLLNAQWAAERGPNYEKLLRKEDRGQPGNIPAHPIGPYGQVYGEAKARALNAGKHNAHADALARRAMLKALIHDVHSAWHGRPLDYTFTADETSHMPSDSRDLRDRPSATPPPWRCGEPSIRRQPSSL